MSMLRSSSRFRLGAMLCIALAALFAGMGLSRTMDRMQHESGSTQQHGHMLFGGLSVEEAHDADHDGPQMQDADEQDPLPESHHHHHGDSGSGMIPIAQSAMAMLLLDSARHGLPQDNVRAGSAIDGPKRPPRQGISSV
ncbi:hypothetical protein [Sphingobium sp.]|uniref:hypothetical protein n=1 Tax=Sphingobium sp. TaxID=1912891 RepID=UPI003BB774D1